MLLAVNGLYKNLASILLGILILVVGAWATNTNLRVDKQDERLATTREQVISNQKAIEYLIKIAEENQRTLQDVQKRLAQGVRR